MSEAPSASPTGTVGPIRFTLRSPRLWGLMAAFAVLAAGAQLIGPAQIPLGPAAVTLLPMVWGLVGGLVVSTQRWRPLGLDLQAAASSLMWIAILLLVARLSFEIGPNLGLLVEAGPALFLQEFGHLFGTILLALPLAVLLKMGPATIGATFSIDREPAFGMVSERYGPDSHEYRGVLSMYIFGSVFGAALVSVIASICASLQIFDPLALAMGSGVGSGSMMAAAAASVVDVHPELEGQVLAVAAISNMLTGLLGVYVGMYVALPLADRLYHLLSRTPRTAAATTGTATGTATEPAEERPVTVSIPLWTSVPLVLLVGLIVSFIAAKGFSWSILGAYAVITAVMLASIGLYRLTRGKVSAIIAVVTIGALITTPLSPVGEWIHGLMETVSFTAIVTPVLTAAGLSLGKDLVKIRSIGWKIIPVGIVAITASYVLSTLVAELVLGLLP
ncbi:DUF3100 domain-containing protein [Pseudonocardia sp. C8]|uniref:DUF3100 domain-containing protein n=1 Tax=Pseudonocardia sp. C8 TaxID=2762759 RepID=UPI00164332D2|nr:DUF3100 domain-containing protein [Pseudonocardia sp. C8]MBC3192817.1 DUF3100 domain-containing protein [Pseudonocardia sp. C8]